MTKAYFSSRNGGQRERTAEDVSKPLWDAIISCIMTFISKDYFAEKFPIICPDGRGVISGTNETNMVSMIKGRVECITEWPPRFRKVETTKNTLLDIIEFAHEYISKPQLEPDNFHDHRIHYHYLHFDKELGQSELQEQVNGLFACNSLIYNLQKNGEVTRIGPILLRDELEQADFRTTDHELNRLLVTARRKFSSKDASQRIEALEKLWDAWERVKTITNPGDKRMSIEKLLNSAIPDPDRELRERINSEAIELTEIGNNFMIRHTEVGKPPIRKPEHVDYLFHRLFALLYLLLKSVPTLPVPPHPT